MPVIRKKFLSGISGIRIRRSNSDGWSGHFGADRSLIDQITFFTTRKAKNGAKSQQTTLSGLSEAKAA
jgi:hypothetical protein